jgi:hypothetical protein
MITTVMGYDTGKVWAHISAEIVFSYDWLGA